MVNLKIILIVAPEMDFYLRLLIVVEARPLGKVLWLITKAAKNLKVVAKYQNNTMVKIWEIKSSMQMMCSKMQQYSNLNYQIKHKYLKISKEIYFRNN